MQGVAFPVSDDVINALCDMKDYRISYLQMVNIYTVIYLYCKLCIIFNNYLFGKTFFKYKMKQKITH